jgi:hypothetical protein
MSCPCFPWFFYFYLSIFSKICPVSGKFGQKSPRRIPEKIVDLLVKSAVKSSKLAEFQYSRFLLFLHRLQCISAEFFKNRRNRWGSNFHLPPIFQTWVRLVPIIDTWLEPAKEKHPGVHFGRIFQKPTKSLRFKFSPSTNFSNMSKASSNYRYLVGTS